MSAFRSILPDSARSTTCKGSWRIRKLLLFLVCLLPCSKIAAQTTKRSAQSTKAQANLFQKQPQEQEFRNHFEEARTFQSQGDQEHAELEYKVFLAEALRRSANLHAHLGEYGLAEKQFEAVLPLAPANFDALADYAALQLEQGKAAEAKSIAERAVQAAPQNPRANFLLGSALFQQGDYGGAKEHLEAAVVGARNFETGYLLGITYLKLNDLAHADLLFHEMVSGLGDTAQIHMYLGRAYRDGGFVERAVEELKKAVTKDPAASQVHYFLGLAYLGRDGDSGFAEAIPEFQVELKKNPNDYRSRYLLGYIFLKQHKLREAEAELVNASRLDTSSPDPLIYLGQLYSESGRPQQAVDALKNAIELTKDESRNEYQVNRAHYLLGRLLLSGGKTEEGHQELRKSQELRTKAMQLARKRSSGDAPNLAEDELPSRKQEPRRATPSAERAQAVNYINTLQPAIADSYNNLGVIAAGKHDFVSALDYFRNAGEWQPDLATLDRNLGMAAFYAKHFAEATEPLQRHLRRQSDDTRARAALGLSLFSLQKFADVRQALKPIEAEVNSDPGLAYAYAVSLVKTGEYSDGVKRLRELESSNTHSAEIHTLLGEAFADQGEWGSALEEYRKALALEPQQVRAHFLAGLALIHEGQPSEAAAEMRAVLQVDPSNLSAKYQLAFALIQMEQKQEALVLLREVLLADPKFSDAYYQLGKLQLEQGETKAAISNFEAGTKFSPDSDYLHYQLALAYRRDSRLEDAEREMKMYQSLKDRRRSRAVPESN
jgi:tetratricopeptide (TPR) repeat protein